MAEITLPNVGGVIDSHAHIDFDHYSDDRDEMLARMRDAGVSDVICIGTRLTHQHGPRQMAEYADNIWFTAGVHPNHAHDQDDYDNIDAYRAAVDHPRCVGIGEAGLDYFYTKSDPERQMTSFKIQLQVAAEKSLPIVIHSRDADQDMAETIENAASKTDVTGVMHCFSSGAELAERALKIGFYISFSGILTFKNTENLREIAKTVPLDRVLEKPMRRIFRPNRCAALNVMSLPMLCIHWPVLRKSTTKMLRKWQRSQQRTHDVFFIK